MCVCVRARVCVCVCKGVVDPLPITMPMASISGYVAGGKEMDDNDAASAMSPGCSMPRYLHVRC